MKNKLCTSYLLVLEIASFSLLTKAETGVNNYDQEEGTQKVIWVFKE
jgi:hypothetical protein